MASHFFEQRGLDRDETIRHNTTDGSNATISESARRRRGHRKRDAPQCQQGANMRVRSEIAGLPRAIESTAPARSRLVNAASTRLAEVWAPSIDGRQDRSVIKEHAAMAGTAASLALSARQYYQKCRTDSAAIGAWR